MVIWLCSWIKLNNQITYHFLLLSHTNATSAMYVVQSVSIVSFWFADYEDHHEPKTWWTKKPDNIIQRRNIDPIWNKMSTVYTLDNIQITIYGQHVTLATLEHWNTWIWQWQSTYRQSENCSAFNWDHVCVAVFYSNLNKNQLDETKLEIAI